MAEPLLFGRRSGPATSSRGGARRSTATAHTKAEERGRRGAGGSPAHQEHEYVVEESRGGRTTPESSAAATTGGGEDEVDSRQRTHFGTIPSSGRKRRPRRSSRWRRLGLGQPETVAIRGGRRLGFGRGGEEERELGKRNEPGREKEKRSTTTASWFLSAKGSKETGWRWRGTAVAFVLCQKEEGGRKEKEKNIYRKTP